MFYYIDFSVLYKKKQKKKLNPARR